MYANVKLCQQPTFGNLKSELMKIHTQHTPATETLVVRESISVSIACSCALRA